MRRARRGRYGWRSGRCGQGESTVLPVLAGRRRGAGAGERGQRQSVGWMAEPSVAPVECAPVLGDGDPGAGLEEQPAAQSDVDGLAK